MLQLEKYHSPASRHACPSCGHKRVFSRYVDDSGQFIDETVGRCNREVECGYHLKPREYFAANGTDWTPKPAPSKPIQPTTILTEIPASYFEKSQTGMERNAFVGFLLSRYDRADVLRVCEAYSVGDFEGFTTFWRKDVAGSLWTAKLIKYDATTGKRYKGDYATNWLHSILKKRGVLPQASDYKRVMFGAHLLSDDTATVALVEAEKTATIAALELTEFIWLASGGRTQINVEKLAQLGHQRVILFPDGDAFEEWSNLAHQARAEGLDVHVSDLLETELTNKQKADGWDLADYLLAPEPINAQVEVAGVAIQQLKSPLSFADLWQAADEAGRYYLDERAATLEFEAGFSRVEAEGLVQTESVNFCASCRYRLPDDGHCLACAGQMQKRVA